MTREELIKQASQNLKISASRADKATFAREVFEAGAKWADKNPKSPWISVEERLPELGKEVIVSAKDKYVDIDQLANNGEGGYYWWKNERVIFCEEDKITHWMPIPEL